MRSVENCGAARWLALTCLSLVGCPAGGETPIPTTVVSTPTAQVSADVESQIIQFCSGCHTLPAPESFPKSMWADEVKQGFDFYFNSDRKDLSPPAQLQAVEYFRSRAPEALPPIVDRSENRPTTLAFRADELAETGASDSPPAISFVDWTDFNGGRVLLTSDMKLGRIRKIDTQSRTVKEWRELATNPAVVRVCDLNQNGQLDLIVCDLGSFLPADHKKGRLVWWPDIESQQTTPVALLEGVGRIADAQIGDFDGDERPDVVVAEFGWHKTGGIHVLYQKNRDSIGRPVFEKTTVDARPGTIHVPTIDLNGDGRLDFVALISQEHEQVIAYLNLPGGYEKLAMTPPLDPSYGSSGIELVDLDLDGDVDVLYTNGDTFDSKIIKPTHGIVWLENRGSYPFAEHHLTSLPGVYRALSTDLDGDDDLDIVAAAMLPQNLLRQSQAANFDSVIWLEQSPGRQFVRHAIEQGSPLHAALAVGDFDGDHDADVAVGNFLDETQPDRSSVTVFWNGREP